MAKLVYDLDIYTFDIDQAGHVNNAVYIRWMEIGRSKMMEAVGWPIHETLKREFYPVLVRTEIFYQRPLFVYNRVTIEMWVSNTTQARVELAFEFYNEKRLLVATAKQMGAFVHLKTNRPRRLTLEERALFDPFRFPEELP